MTLKSAPYWWAVCDVCGISAQEGSDYSAYSEAEHADIEPEDAGWHVEGGNHICEECVVTFEPYLGVTL